MGKWVTISRRYWPLASFQVRGKAMTKNHPPCLNGLEVFPRGVGSIRYHDNHLAPGGQHQTLKHFSKQSVLRPVAFALFGLHQPEGQRHTIVVPLGDEEHDMQPTGKRSILIETPFFDQGILFSAFALQGTIPHQEQDPIVRRWESR